MDDVHFRQWVREQEKPEKIKRKTPSTVTIERKPVGGSSPWEPVFSVSQKQALKVLRQARCDKRHVYRVKDVRS